MNLNKLSTCIKKNVRLLIIFHCPGPPLLNVGFLELWRVGAALWLWCAVVSLASEHRLEAGRLH